MKKKEMANSDSHDSEETMRKTVSSMNETKVIQEEIDEDEYYLDEYEDDNSDEDEYDLDEYEDDNRDEDDVEDGWADSEMETTAKKSGVKTALIVFGSIIVVLSAIYAGISVFFMSHFFVNTEINGYDFSAKTVSDVENYIQEQVQGYQLKILEKNNKTDMIEGQSISLNYKKNTDIQDALKEQKSFLWPLSFFSKRSTKITIQVDYEEVKLDEAIKNMQSVKAEQTPSQSARPHFDGNQYVIEPEVIGTTVQMDVLKEKIQTAIVEFQTELNMEKEGCYEKPKYTSESEEVKQAVDTLNNYCKANITYTMSETVVVDKAVISSWLTVGDDMNVTFNEAAIREWLTAFGDKFDTVGVTRSFVTPTGKSAQVSGGTYGWSIDEDAEFTALIESIKHGETVSKEPAYYQTAAAHAAVDWGNTYLEVDLSTQHMWYIVNGAIALETAVVTGYPSPELETPTGVYSILEMEKNKTLIGNIVPETGKPEYETPVSFWMRATWSGIGFHDATWQPAFGGSLYTTNGSHGCINMPYGQAEALYNMLKMKTPVILHY